MDERHLYREGFKFEGSIDADGSIYDTRHRQIGHVDGNTIYDVCNIPCGHIDDDGQVVDTCNVPIGKETGANFLGWGGHGSGLARNDVLGTGHGNDYGVFSLVKDANRKYRQDDDLGTSDDDDDWSCSSQKPKRSKRKQTGDDGNGRRKSDGCRATANDAAGCFDAIAGLAMLIVIIIMICNLIKSCWNGEIQL